MLSSSWVRVGGMGTEGTKNGTVDSSPTDTFGSRTLDQLLHNGVSPVADSSSRRTRDWSRSANGQVGSPSRSSPRDKSPPSLHQAFVRDSGNQWNSGKAPRRSEWFSSPDRQYRYERDDRWAQPLRRSSPNRKASPPRRSSPPRQSSYGYSERLRSPVVHPPNSQGRHARRESDTFDFSNLSWRVPDHVKSQFSDCDVSGSEDSKPNRGAAPSCHSFNGTPQDPSAGRVSYNGLKGVPTGPKKGFSTLPPVSASIKDRPHIFVSSEHLPPKRSTVEHLYGALKQSQPDIHFDSTGWYLGFEDTRTGRAKLQDCYQRRNKMRLFGEYTIHMEPFLYGTLAHSVLHNRPTNLSPSSYEVTDSNALNDTTVDLSTSNSSALETSVPRDATAHAEASRETVDGDALYLDGLLPNSNGINGSHVEDEESALSKVLRDVDSSALSGIRHSLGWQSSPLRVPSRFDREDSSSCISILTGSDGSRSKRVKCHVCKTSDLSDSDTLITCSSCPRKYHRRCHLHPAIPTELDHVRTWQCRRCTKKQGKPQSNLRGSSPATAPITRRLDLPPSEPPRKRLRPDSAEPHSFSVPSAIDATVGDDDDDDYVPSEVLAQPLTAIERNLLDETAITTKNSGPQSDETHFHEADDLVAKSFAALPGVSMPPAITTPGKKPALVRRKVSRPEKSHHRDTAIETQTTLGLHKEQVLSVLEESMTHAVDDLDGIDDEIPDRKRKVPRLNGDLVDQSGMQNMNGPIFGRRDLAPTTLHTSLSTMLTTGHEAPAPAPIEIPESPEEMRKPTHMIITANGTMKLTERSAIDAELLNHEAVMDKALEGKTNAQRQHTKLQRTKPGVQTTDRCKNCFKEIAYNPSGGNKYCMRCKAAMSATPSVDSATSLNAVGTKAISEQSALVNVDEKPSESVVREDSGFEPAGAPDTRLDSLPAGADAIAGPEPLENNLHNSCEECKLSRRRCTHIESAASRQGDNDHQAKSQEARTDSKDVLDFWTIAVTISDKENSSDVGAVAMMPEMPSQTQPPDDSEMLSDAAEDMDEAPRTAVPKRKSQTRPAMSQHDLGDSIERPKGAYEKLIGMALCSAPGHRMRGTDVTDWVAKNISGYRKGEGKWESSLRATLTLKKQGYGGRDGLWEKIESAGAKKNETCWWQLLPGQADKMLHWDPVLGQPVSPLKSSQKEHTMILDHEEAGASEEDLPSALAPKLLQARRKKQERRRRLRQGQSGSVKAALSSAVDIESHQSAKDRITDINSSSEEEPLVKRTKPTPTASLQSNDAARVDTAKTVAYPSTSAQDPSPFQRPPQLSKPAFASDEPQQKNTILTQYPSKPVSPADMIALEAEDTQYSAKSLFAEWPEYDSKNNLNAESKIAQIKKRPTRKQKFNKRFEQGFVDRQRLVAEMGSPHPAIEYVAMNESPSKTGRSVLYPWETIEDNVVQCTTLQELFNLPKNPVAIIHDGQLAYRDGTRNEDGTLPRAKVIYKTGYGKGDTGR